MVLQEIGPKLAGNRRIMKKLLMMFVLAAFVTPMVGCKEKGPMESAGEKIDQAAKDTKDATKDAYKDTTNRVSKATR